MKKNLSMFVVAAVATINSPTFARPLHRYLPSAVADDPTTAACVFKDGTSPAGRPESHCYEPAQFLKAYGIDQLQKNPALLNAFLKEHGITQLPENGLSGQGQTIILADSFGTPTAQADLDHFSDAYGLPHTTIQFIYPDGPFVNPLANADQLGWAYETTLDLEWAHAIAPNATIVNIVTNVSETTGVTGLPDLFKGFQMAAAQYPGGIISMSFGTGEATFTADEIQSYLQGSFHQTLQQVTDAGMTLLAGAGDWGTTNMNTDSTSYYSFPNAFYPSSDPLITSVGGTALQADWLWNPQGTADDYWNCQLQGTATCPTDFFHFLSSPGTVLESVWKEDWAVAAGGGGVSTAFTTPQFQSNLGAGVQALANGHRTVPDVSLNAAINGGVTVYTGFTAPALGVTAPQWQAFGGTSCATPETAAIVALAGEAASLALKKTAGIGSLNPLLYSLNKADFNDIVSQTIGVNNQVTIDNNALYFNAAVLAKYGPTKVPPVAVPGYKTTVGYDLATGLGSPKAASFALDLARAKVAQVLNGN